MTADRKDTWMPMYWGDYVRDTGHLNAAGHGAYLMLIKHYWCTGAPLADDDDELWRIACCDSKKEWLSLKPRIAKLFVTNDGLLIHKRVEHEMAKTSAITSSKSKAGKLGALSKWGKTENPDHVTKRSQRLAEARERGTHSKTEWEIMVEYHGGRCAKCAAETEGTPTKDHITPIYQGGADDIFNIQPLCRGCNSSKGPDRTDYRKSEWLAEMPDETRSRACQTPGSAIKNAWQNDAPSQSPLPEEETPLRGAKKSRASPRTAIDPDWQPNEAGQDYARQRGVTRAEVPKFINHHLAHGKVMASWDRAWMTWCDNAVKFGNATPPPDASYSPTPMTGGL